MNVFDAYEPKISELQPVLAESGYFTPHFSPSHSPAVIQPTARKVSQSERKHEIDACMCVFVLYTAAYKVKLQRLRNVSFINATVCQRYTVC